MTAEPWVPEAPEDEASDERPEETGLNPWDYDLASLTDLWDNRDKTLPPEQEIEF